MAKAGDGAIDKTRVQRLEAQIIQPIFFQPTHFEILNQNIAFGRQFADQRLPLWLGNIDGDAFLIPIGRQVISRKACVAVAMPRRAPTAGIIPLVGLFNLDDLSPQIPQHLRAPRPCENAGQVKHADARKRFGHIRSNQLNA